MPLNIIGVAPENLFEQAVFRECSKINVEGILSANIFLPSKESGLDEQDIIIVTGSIIFTIDAKAYEPGHYRGGLNQPLQFRGPNDDTYREISARLAKPLATATYKAKQLITLLDNTKERIGINLKNINRLGIRVISLIVVPDHAVFEESECHKSEKFMKNTAICRVVQLSQLSKIVKEEIETEVPLTNLIDEKKQLIDEFINILKDGIPEHERRISDIMLLEKLKEYDTVVPVQVWKGVKDGENVIVKIFFKYPWREESSNFFRQLFYQTRAFKKARVARVVVLEEYQELPEYTVMAFEWFENEGTLEDAVSALRGLRIQDAVILLRRIAETVRELHDDSVRAPIILRSLHPNNILIDKWHGEVNWAEIGFLITGFEKAVIQGRSSAGSEGRSAYDAPELSFLTDRKTRQSKTLDVYSLGVLLVFLLTGRHPIINEEFDAHFLNIPQGIISRATAANPTKRYQTIRDFLDDLQNI